MKILNIMFSKELGGIEQVFLDYNHALMMQNFNVIPVIHPRAKIKKQLNCHYVEVFNFSRFDLFAISKLRKIIQTEQPNCIITHGNRAVQLVSKIKGNTPLIAVCHNYNFKSLLCANAIIAITNHLKTQLIKAGKESEAIHIVPNMIHLSEDITYEPRAINYPPLIGVIGRLVKKKGFDVFIKSLYELKKQKIEFTAKIAGLGDEELRLKKLAESLKLTDDIEFIGWVEYKAKFYKSIDIFCLPSQHEPFGLVLLEAMKYSKPIITTATEGPLEIIDKDSADIVPIGDYKAMSKSIIRIIKDENYASNLSEGAFKRVQDFSILNIARQLKIVIENVCFNNLLK